MASVTYRNAERTYPGAEHPAVSDLNIDIGDGEFMVFVGPSGCGKSTSLRMLAGLEDVTAGDILIGDRSVAHVPPKDRDIAMVFQNYALYPHMTVADNMAFALKVAGVGKAERIARVNEAADLLDLREYLQRKPKALSGGQRQRVAMGRAIVRQPQVFLHGRAALQSRCQTSGFDPDADCRPAAATRRHHRLRHPRSGRGDDHGRPRRGPQGRRPATGRHPTRAVPNAREPVRRRLHRIARDESAGRRNS